MCKGKDEAMKSAIFELLLTIRRVLGIQACLIQFGIAMIVVLTLFRDESISLYQGTECNVELCVLQPKS